MTEHFIGTQIIPARDHNAQASDANRLVIQARCTCRWQYALSPVTPANIAQVERIAASHAKNHGQRVVVEATARIVG